MEVLRNDSEADPATYIADFERALSREDSARQASGSIIFDRTAEEYIFIRRDNIPTIPWPDMIGIVGGGMDPGETPEVACRREVGEELRYSDTGAPVEVGEVRPLVTFVNGSDTRIHMHMTEVEDASNIQIGDEGQEIVRFDFKRMIQAARSGEFADDFNGMILTVFAEQE